MTQTATRPNPFKRPAAPIYWRGLIAVQTGDNDELNLGGLVDVADCSLRDIAFKADGSIAYWNGFTVIVPGGKALDAPDVSVDWDGFQDAVREATAQPERTMPNESRMFGVDMTRNRVEAEDYATLENRKRINQRPRPEMLVLIVDPDDNVWVMPEDEANEIEPDTQFHIYI